MVRFLRWVLLLVAAFGASSCALVGYTVTRAQGLSCSPHYLWATGDAAAAVLLGVTSVELNSKAYDSAAPFNPNQEPWRSGVSTGAAAALELVVAAYWVYSALECKERLGVLLLPEEEAPPQRGRHATAQAGTDRFP
jgi:hypothetical protein